MGHSTLRSYEQTNDLIQCIILYTNAHLHRCGIPNWLVIPQRLMQIYTHRLSRNKTAVLFTTQTAYNRCYVVISVSGFRLRVAYRPAYLWCPSRTRPRHVASPALPSASRRSSRTPPRRFPPRSFSAASSPPPPPPPTPRAPPSPPSSPSRPAPSPAPAPAGGPSGSRRRARRWAGGGSRRWWSRPTRRPPTAGRRGWGAPPGDRTWTCPRRTVASARRVRSRGRARVRRPRRGRLKHEGPDTRRDGAYGAWHTAGDTSPISQLPYPTIYATHNTSFIPSCVFALRPISRAIYIDIAIHVPTCDNLLAAKQMVISIGRK